MDQKAIDDAITALCGRSHENAVSHGWWDHENDTVFGKLLMVHSEISETVEELRAHRDPTEIHYEGEKPCGVAVEIADILIRLFDLCEKYEIPLAKALRLKMAYNETRPMRHGGKAI